MLIFSSRGGGGIFSDDGIRQIYPFIDLYRFDVPQQSAVSGGVESLPKNLQEMFQCGDKAAFFRGFRQHIFSPENQEAYQEIVDSFATAVRETDLDLSSVSVFTTNDGQYRIHIAAKDLENWPTKSVEMKIWLEAQRLQEEGHQTGIDSQHNYLTLSNPGAAIKGVLDATHPRALTSEDIWQNVADYFAASKTAATPITLNPLQEKAVRERISQYYDQCEERKLDDFWVRDEPGSREMGMMQPMSSGRDPQHILMNMQTGNPVGFEEMKAWSYEQAKRDPGKLQKITEWYAQGAIKRDIEKGDVVIDKPFSAQYGDGKTHATFGIRVGRFEGESDQDYAARKADIENMASVFSGAELLHGYNPSEKNFVDTVDNATAVLNMLQLLEHNAKAAKGNGWTR